MKEMKEGDKVGFPRFSHHALILYRSSMFRPSSITQIVKCQVCTRVHISGLCHPQKTRIAHQYVRLYLGIAAFAQVCSDTGQIEHK